MYHLCSELLESPADLVFSSNILIPLQNFNYDTAMALQHFQKPSNTSVAQKQQLLTNLNKWLNYSATRFAQTCLTLEEKVLPFDVKGLHSLKNTPFHRWTFYECCVFIRFKAEDSVDVDDFFLDDLCQLSSFDGFVW